MGNLGFDDFCDLLKFRAGNRADLESATPSSTVFNLYGIWTNSAYRQLCTQDGIFGLKKKLYFPQLFTNTHDSDSTHKHTVDGTAFVAVPDGCLYITEVFDTTNGKRLTNIPWKKYIGYTDRTDAASEGDPTEWVRHEGRIYLHPTPGTTGDEISIYYKKLVADLSGTLTTDIGGEWDDAIIELASYKMFTWLHEYDKAKLVRESFLEMAAGLADIYNKEEKDRNESWGPSSSYLS